MNWTQDGWPICPHCERDFRYDKGPKGDIDPPPCCGIGMCWAKEYWDKDQWAGKARMAEARLAAAQKTALREGITRVPYEIDDWDREALAR